MIEANYSDEVVADKMSKGFDIKQRKSRLIESHMSIDTALDFIKRINLTSFRKFTCCICQIVTREH
jgi:hypothetical protein